MIKNLGPIDKYEIECKDFMVFTGKQSSGKSTVVKALYFFRSVKEDIVKFFFDYYRKYFNEREKNIEKQLKNVLKLKFHQMFGCFGTVPNGMEIYYEYQEGVFIKIKQFSTISMKNVLEVTISSEISKIFHVLEKDVKDLAEMPLVDPFQNRSIGFLEIRDKITISLDKLFCDDKVSLFIPAGRSALTLLSDQLLLFYSILDDKQKKMMDYCTEKYIKEVLRCKPLFSPGSILYEEMEEYPFYDFLQKLIDSILQGNYAYLEGEERLYYTKKDFVKLNFASSGQQEAVWICNFLTLYGLNKRKTVFFIEEPEAHLFPETQQEISNLIALISNQGNEMVLTTHSPYVLSSLNNLFYAKQVGREEKRKKVEEIIPSDLWLDYEKVGAWFLKEQHLSPCIDLELKQIDQEKIDEISQEINEKYEKISNIFWDV